MKVLLCLLLPALLLAHGAPALAQTEIMPPPDTTPASGTEIQQPPAEQAPPVVEIIEAAGDSAGPITIPALTRIEIELLAELGTNLNKSGDSFPFRLAEPVVIDGKEAIPAGTGGMGEVVHAKKSGAAGAAGELVLAARYLDVDGRRLKLRSLRSVPQGKNLTGAAGAASIGMGVFAFLIKGGQSVLPWGTRAEAKTAEVFTLSARPAPPPSAEAPSPTRTEVPPEQPADEPQQKEDGGTIQ